MVCYPRKFVNNFTKVPADKGESSGEEKSEQGCAMRVGKSLRRMDWRARRLMRGCGRDLWWGEQYGSGLPGKPGSVPSGTPDDFVQDRSAEKHFLSRTASR